MANKVLPTIYKNQLQQHTQKFGKQLPNYQTDNLGSQHLPRFRTTVIVDGVKYKSKSTHPTKKQAEQEAAKVAYECILAYECIQEENDSENYTFLDKQPMLSKTILYEFATKKKMNEPAYNSILYARGRDLVYVCHVILDGKSTYMGEEAVNKKMAEQLAARAAIESLLKTDDAETLSRIIMSKDKCRHDMQIKKDANSSENMLPRCSGNLQDQNPKNERALVSVDADVIIDNSKSTRQKRKRKTNNSKRNKKRRRSGN